MISNLRFFSVLMFLTLLCSHSTSTRDKIFNEVDTFLNYAKQKNDKAIYNMAYHINYPNNITDSESRKIMVNYFSELISKYGVPSHNKWVLEETSLDYEVHIPISNFNELNTSFKNVELVIFYTPSKIANQIYQFEVRNEIDTSKRVMIQEPPLAK
jgi:hypothetical protein